MDTETKVILESQIQNNDRNQGSNTQKRFQRGSNAYTQRATQKTSYQTVNTQDRNIQDNKSRNMSQDSSDDENQVLINSFYKSDMKPYYDPYSKPAVELNEMTKKSSTKRRSSDKFETDFRIGQGNLNQSYKPKQTLNLKQNETDDGENDNSESDINNFKSTGVGFSPDKIRQNKTEYKRSSVSKERQGYYSSSTDQYDLKSNQNSTTHYYKVKGKSKYGKKDSGSDRDHLNDQEWSAAQSSDMIGSDSASRALSSQYAYLYPQKQNFQKEQWNYQNRSGATLNASNQPSTQKEKKKRKKEQPPEPHFMLSGGLSQYLETRTFYHNSDTQKLQNQQKTNSSGVQNSNPGSPQALREWFESLSVQDRVNSLTSTFSIMAHSIIEVSSKQKYPHSHVLSLYTIKKEKQSEQLDQAPLTRRRQGQPILDINECLLERVHNQDDRLYGYTNLYPETSEVRSFQTMIIKSTRITSNKQQKDTITISSELVKNSDEFFSLIANATDDKAFQEPVYFVTRNGSGSKPVIETPKWIKKNSSHYLGIWIIALWEEALWAHFNYARQVNIGPGVRKNDIQQLFEHRKQNLQNQEDLAKRWQDLGEEGQKRLFDKLIEESKKVTVETLLQAEQKEYERRSQLYGNSLTAYSGESSENLPYYYTQSSQRYGLYYTDIRHNYDSIYRGDDGYGYPRGSINSYTILDQQGVQSGQHKLMLMFLPTQDSDLKEILDVTNYTSSLETIKYLSEFPLQEINVKNHIRRHYICDLLYKYIQEDLRQSIQEQLMNELLAIDSNSTAKNLQNNGDAEEKQKKKKKTDNRKKKQKTEQTKVAQTNQTYQKKKSLSKSPSRDAEEDLQQQVQDESDSKQKDSEFVNKQQQPKQVQTQSQNNKPISREAHHGVASTTTSDDQAYQIDQKQHQSVYKEKSPVRKTNNKQRDNKKSQAQEQQPKKKPAQNQQQKKEILSITADQVQVSEQIKALLCDLVEKVCQIEYERQIQEQTLSEQQKRSVESDSDKQDIINEKLSHHSVQILDQSLAQSSTLSNAIVTDSEPQSQNQVNNSTTTQQPKKRKRNKKKQDASEIMNNFMRKINGEDREDDIQAKNNSMQNRNKQAQSKQEPERNQGRKQSGINQNGQQQRSNNPSYQKSDQNKQIQQSQKPNNGRKQNEQGQKQIRNENIEKADIKRPDVQTNDKEQQKGQKVFQSDQDKSNSQKSKSQVVQHQADQTVQQSSLKVQTKKPKLLETKTYQFFQLENQQITASDDNSGGIFVSNFQEQPNVNQQPFSSANQVMSNTSASFQIIDQPPQINSAQVQQVPQREAINLTAEFQKPNFNFGNILDFGIRDHHIDQSNNIYENSKVRRIDYQHTNQVPQTKLFELESSVSVPLEWKQTEQTQMQHDLFQGFNQTAMSTNSVSFTPTVQLSPQISVRSEDQFSDVHSQQISSLQRQEIEPLNLSPPIVKTNFQAPPTQISEQLNFYPQQYPYQHGLQQQQFDQSHYKYQHQNNYQQDHHNGSKSYNKGKAPFRPPQYNYYQNQRHLGVNRSPTNIHQTQDYFQVPFSSNDPIKNNWVNQTNTFAGSPNVVQPNFAYSQPGFHNQTVDRFSNSTISVNAPDFYPQPNNVTGQFIDQWNITKFMPQNPISPQTLNTGFSQPNYLGQQSRVPTEGDILFAHFEDAFYSQFDFNIQETTIKVQKAVEKFDEQRKYVLEMLQMMANKAFPGSKPVLRLFGSLMTGLALETSDMDIAVTGLRIDDKMAMIDDLHALEDEIKKWPIIKDLKAIETASIPVIKANISMKAISKEMLKSFSEDIEDQNLPIDITFDDTPKEVTDQFKQNMKEKSFLQSQMGQSFSPPFGTDFRGNMIQTHSNSNDPIPQLFNFIVGELTHNLGANEQMNGFGIDFGNQTQTKMHQGMISCDVIREYVRDYPCLKEVVLLLKRFLAANNLNSAYQGGISSYSTVLLVVAYMNNFSLHKSPHLTPSRLLMGFLEFYCNHFDPKVFGVNTANGGSYYVLPPINQSQQQFFIQDPVQASNNTARNSYRTPEVLNHFRSAFYSLRNQIMKEYQKHLDSERLVKGETELGQQVIDVSLTAQSNQVVHGSKTEKSNDGSGTRLKQAQHKKVGTQSQQETVATKALEQQQNLHQLSSGQPAQTQSVFTQAQITSNVGRARFSIAQTFSSVNFVEKFLSQEILNFNFDQQSSVVEPMTGFGPF